MLDLSILIPVLGRSQQIPEVLADIAAATPPVYEVVFIASKGDIATARTLVTALEAGSRFKVFTLPPNRRGDYAIKINYAYEQTTTPHLFLAASDLHFHPGWYDEAVRALTAGVGVVGTQDLGNGRVLRGEHATHCLVTREYVKEYGTIDEPGKILHEGYWHEYVDDELVGTAKHRKAWAFAPLSFVEHMHPMWGKAPNDPMYAKQKQRMSYSRKLFKERQRMWT